MVYNFFFPYHYPSGVSTLFKQLGQAIGDIENEHVKLIDFRDGPMAYGLEARSKVQFVEFKKDSAIVIGAGETLVIQGQIPGNLPRQLKIHDDARIVEWQLHPHNFVPPPFPLIGHKDWWLQNPVLYEMFMRGLYKTKMKHITEFVMLLSSRQSLFFYDHPALHATERYLGCTVPNPIFLPVPIELPVTSRHVAWNSEDLHVAWIGRLYDFKIHILVRTIERFIEYSVATGRTIVFHVVGDGPEARRLTRFGCETGGLKLIRYGDLPFSRMLDLLNERIHIVASMGTAALHGAASGLPVMLLDLSYTEVSKDYRYRWLHDTQGFDLGHTITNADCDSTRDSFVEMMTDLTSNYEQLARKSYLYVQQNHGVETVTNRFLELTRRTDLCFRDVPAIYWKKTTIRQIYEFIRY